MDHETSILTSIDLNLTKTRHNSSLTSKEQQGSYDVHPPSEEVQIRYVTEDIQQRSRYCNTEKGKILSVTPSNLSCVKPLSCVTSRL